MLTKQLCPFGALEPCRTHGQPTAWRTLVNRESFSEGLAPRITFRNAINSLRVPNHILLTLFDYSSCYPFACNVSARPDASRSGRLSARHSSLNQSRKEAICCGMQKLLIGVRTKSWGSRLSGSKTLSPRGSDITFSATCCVPLEGAYGLPFEIVGHPSPSTPKTGGHWSVVSA
jgi:hypothetical protein